MSAEAPTLTRSWKVGKRTVTMTVPPVVRGQARCMAMEWSPSMPRRLTKRELREYRIGRDAAVVELAEQTGLRALVVEV